MNHLSSEALEERVSLLVTLQYAEFRELTRGQSEQQNSQLQRRLAEADMEEVDLLERFECWPPDDDARHLLLPALGLSSRADASRLERLLRLVPEADQALPYHIGESLQARFSSQPALAQDLLARIELDASFSQRAYRVWANSYTMAQPKSAAQFLVDRSGPPVTNPRAISALVVALPWRLDDVQKVIAPHHPKVLALLSDLASSDPEGAWGCIVELAQFDVGAYRIVAGALSEGIPAAASSVARSIFRIDGVSYGAERVPLTGVLQRLVELALRDQSVGDSMNLALSSCLRKPDQKSLAYNCLVGLGEGPNDALARFNLTFQAVSDDPSMFARLLTNWLLSPTTAYPVIRDLLGFIHAQRVLADLDEELFAEASPTGRIKAIRRLLGLHSDGPSLCQFAACVARMESLGENGLRLALEMFNFLKDEYPGAIENFLKPLTTPELRRERGAVIFRSVYASSLRWTRHLERLPRRPELRSSDADAFSLRSARIKQNGIIHSRQTSLSDAEQERFAKAIKSDLIDVHLGRSMLSQGKVQALRLLLVAHRQGKNRTPLLEMRRDALSPGLIPGTIRMRTLKHRNKKVRASVGRAAQIEPKNILSDVQPEEEDILFNLAEGAVLQQAITSSRALVSEAPAAFKQRIWLYRVERTSFSTRKGSVACLNVKFLQNTIDNLVQRHNLQGDDGQPMRLNLSRLRKSFFDRALRVADGDMAITANLMGNTPGVAETHYPSMNEARKAQAAGFMNEEYTALMRANAQPEQTPQPQPVQVHPFKSKKGQERSTLPVPTPVASCIDSIHGHHAPRDGRSHCDKFIMCLFCPSFVIVGTIEELWRLFSFQVFAKAELEYLDENLGAERTADAHLEDLRDRYRVAIPYIDDFTQRQFAQSRVAMAQAKTASALHSFWQHQMTLSRRARNKTPAHGLGPTATQGNYRGENHLGF